MRATKDGDSYSASLTYPSFRNPFKKSMARPSTINFTKRIYPHAYRLRSIEEVICLVM